MAENQVINYGMLEEHDQALLKVRPLKNHHVLPLTKAKLMSFLEGNSVPYNKYIHKEGLINQVVQFITSKEALHVQQLAPSEKTKTNSTATNAANGSLALAVDLSKQKKQPLPAPKPSLTPPKPKVVTAGTSIITSTTSAPTTTVIPKASHTVTSGSLTTSAFTTVIPKSHTVTSGSLTTSGPTTVIPKASHTVTRGSLNVVPSATKNVQQPKAPNNADVLQPCNALYIDNLFPAGDEEEWELPPQCSCSISVHDLIKYVPLPQSMVDLLQDMCSKSVQELTEHLQAFGDENAYSPGCRLYLLLQIRDLYEGEAKTLPGFTPGVATVSSNGNIPKPNAATSVQSLLGSKRKPGDVASNLAFPPPQPKVAKPSTVASATVTSATVTSGNSSNHIASATPLSINNSQPEAETTATKLKRLQAHTQLSQDFSKMMSRQLGLASDEAARYKPKIALFDDILEDSSEKECCICIASAREVAFVPCGHTVCCSACSARLNDCPVCRKKIKTKLTLYFS